MSVYKNTDTYNASKAKEENMVGQKIREIRTAKGMTTKDLVSRLHDAGLDVPVLSVQRWENGFVMPNVYQFLSICEALGLTLEDFLTVSTFNGLNAEGKKKLEEYKDLLMLSKLYREKEEEPEEMVEVPVFDFRTGNPIDESLMEKMEFPVSSVPSGTTFAVPISGNSMEPRYHNGQYVFIDKDAQVEPGDIGAFFYNGEAYIKQLHTVESYNTHTVESYNNSNDRHRCRPIEGYEGERIVLVSLNRRYRPIVVDEGLGFRIYGKVLN